ncbi:MAG: heat-inducible transcriptional repressor HrcA [Sedimenticola sp.]|nr:MAG: heat-inducible transcriptional repressor HrcA [Sedimenticola sp.]
MRLSGRLVTGRKTISDSGFNERAQQLLKVLVERYIREGEPVGSRTLARDSGMDLSPATIRNIMSDLEEMGLVASPHTSAGRVPTVSGYRLFIDSLLTVKPLDSREVRELRKQLFKDDDPKGLVESASKLLSSFTLMAGLVMVPKRKHVAFRQIEFLPLTGKRVLTILITREGEVHNRVITTRRQYSPSELEQAANLLNENYAGAGLEEMHQKLVSEMDRNRDDMNRIMRRALEMAEQVISPKYDNDFVVAGQTNLMNFDELSEMNRMRKLFDSFNEKHELLHLLDESMQAKGVQIFIGEESGYQPLDHCSLVTAPYEIDNRVAGVLGVIGPTRMAYDRVISIVDVTAKLLGAALKKP